MENKCLITRPSQTCQLTLIPSVLLFEKKPGLYAFHFFSLAHTQSRTWMELYKNADYVCSIYGFTTHGFADAGNSVLLHLNENDAISIRSHASTNTTLYGTHDQIYTTFTIVFLNPDINGKTPYTYSLYYDFLSHIKV